MSPFWFGLGVSWGGHSMFCVLCFLFLCVWPGVVLNQRQLSIVVSDREPYFGTLFPHLFCGKLTMSLFRAHGPKLHGLVIVLCFVGVIFE